MYYTIALPPNILLVVVSDLIHRFKFNDLINWINCVTKLFIKNELSLYSVYCQFYNK